MPLSPRSWGAIRLTATLGLQAALFCTAAHAAAQTTAQYPTRPVRMIVPYAPGGSSDLTARVLQPHLAEALGQQIVIDNRSGASGYVGVEVAARATPDGYTVLFGNVGTIAINPALYPAFAVKPQRDLVAVTEVADLPSVLVVAPSLHMSTLKDFVAHARTRPGQLNFAGTGSSNRIDTESFMRAAGIRMVHVPYKGGAGPALVGLLANETQVMFALVSGAAGFVKQGRLNALAITASDRSSVLPNVPTMPELGFPTLKSGSWQGYSCRRGRRPQSSSACSRRRPRPCSTPTSGEGFLKTAWPSC